MSRYTPERNEKIRLALIGNKNAKGRVVSRETRMKLSESLRGKKCPWSKKNPQVFVRGQVSWNRGKKMSEEHKEKLRIARKKYFDKIGRKKCKNQRGRQRCVKCTLWRKAIFDRDDYTCQNCGVRGGYLEADHIQSWAHYPKLRHILLNGRTLCRSCHAKTANYKARGKVYVDHKHRATTNTTDVASATMGGSRETWPSSCGAN